MAKRSRRPPRGPVSLRRESATRTPKRTFLVFCEGARTEPDYLRALKQEPDVGDGASVEIRIADDPQGAVPYTLVFAAAASKTRSSEEAGEIDEVWCLFDVEWPDNHPNLDRAVSLAEESGVQVAISNPCFELWLALHFKDHRESLETDEAVALRHCRDGTEDTDKSVDGATYMPKRESATRHARYLSKMHKRKGARFPGDNPSSGMFLFLDAIERGPEGRL